MAATDAMPVPRKATAWRYYFRLYKTDGTALSEAWTGADTEVDKDGAGFSDATNEAQQIGTTNYGYIEFTTTEMDCSALGINITVTNTGAARLETTVYPEEVGDIRTDVVQVSGDSAAADNLELACDNYSATRGLAGTALPAAAAAAAGGIPVSDAGGLDLDGRLDVAVSSRAAASVCSEARLAELDAANLPADVAAVKTGVDGVPTNAEFELRTLPSADYVVVGDTIAGVTSVGSVAGAVGSVTAPVTVGTNSDKTGYTLSAGGVTAVQSGLSTLAAADIRTLVGLAADNLIDELTGAPGTRPTLAGAVMRLYMESANNTTMTALLKTIRNKAGGAVITQAVSDDGTTAAHAKDA